MNKSFFKKTSIVIILGVIIGIAISASLYQTSVHFSTNESCMSCHVHPHAEESWAQSVHVNNRSGVRVNCVDCHLPPKSQTWAHYSSKVKLATHDIWGYLTKDSADFKWDEKSQLENAVKYIPNSSCVECHQNLFPKGISPEALTSHLYYENNAEKLDLQCIGCHLDAGHFNPNYKHGKATSLFGEKLNLDSTQFFKEPTLLTSFSNFEEKIPGTFVKVSMIAIPGGTFKMGSASSEQFHNEDETPIRTVKVDKFYMSEFEILWEQYWSFFQNTKSVGKVPPSVVYANNSRQDLTIDGITGATSSYGQTDQGWGGGQRPAITMTHYGAEIFCLWLSKKTGKKYRLPTEAEWEYAARAQTHTPYFFEGNPAEFSNIGFFRKFIDASTDPIGKYVVYVNNSNNKTQEPKFVEANPFGLKNMLGNVMEYCADKYDPKAYSKTGLEVKNPINNSGEEYVVRGGNYDSDASEVRSASRNFTKNDAWLKRDPQQPKSIWWYTDIRGIGFRVVCEP